MKKLKISDLKVASFVTKDKVKASGGNSLFPQCSGGQWTCAPNCSDTDGMNACKDPTNYTAYFC